MKSVQIDAHLVRKPDGSPAKRTCALCHDQQLRACMALGSRSGDGALVCFSCLRAALVTMAEETGIPLRLYTAVSGVENTTVANISPYDERDE